jgi:hypothetical protein
MSRTRYVILQKVTGTAPTFEILEPIEAHSAAAAKHKAALKHGNGTYNAVAESAWGVPTGYEVKQRPVATEVTATMAAALKQ